MTTVYTNRVSCKDSHGMRSQPKALHATGSLDHQQITPKASNNKGIAVSLALFVAGCAVVTLASLLNIKPILSGSGDALDKGLTAAMAVVATLGFSGLPSASAFLWRSRHRVVAAFVMMLAIGCGALSLTNIVGATFGTRLTASQEVSDTSERKVEARKIIAATETELAALPHTRPAKTVAAEIDAKLTSRADLDGCEGKWLPSSGARAVCIEVAKLKAEKAQADRRDELNAQLAEARGDLIEKGRAVANADTAALVATATRFGWKLDGETVDLVKSVLTALMTEGVAAALFIVAGLVWGARCEATMTAPSTAPASRPEDVRPLPVFAVEGETSERASTPEADRISGPSGGVLGGEHSARQRVIDKLKENAGVVRCSQRGLAKELGVSPGRLNVVLSELATAGLVNVRAGATGTTLSLAALVEA